MIAGDLSDPQFAQKAISEAATALGGIDILYLNHVVNCAPDVSTSHPGMLNQLSPTTFQVGFWGRWFERDAMESTEFIQDIFGKNFFSYVYLATFAKEHLEASRGAVTVVSSAAGLMGLPKVAPYSATKHALRMSLCSSYPETQSIPRLPRQLCLSPFFFFAPQTAFSTPYGTNWRRRARTSQSRWLVLALLTLLVAGFCIHLHLSRRVFQTRTLSLAFYKQEANRQNTKGEIENIPRYPAKTAAQAVIEYVEPFPPHPFPTLFLTCFPVSTCRFSGTLARARQSFYPYVETRFASLLWTFFPSTMDYIVRLNVPA